MASSPNLEEETMNDSDELKMKSAARDAMLVAVAKRLEIAQAYAAEGAHQNDYSRGRSDALTWAVNEVRRMR